MKRTLSLIMALALVFTCVFAFASCGEKIEGVYTDQGGSVWTFKSNRLEIEGTFEVNKVQHKVIAVYKADLTVTGKTEKDRKETLTLVIKEYRYEGDNEVAAEIVEQANVKLGTDTKTEKTAEYTVTYADQGKKITLTKGSVATVLTLKQ